jgi:uridylate kinase
LHFYALNIKLNLTYFYLIKLMQPKRVMLKISGEMFVGDKESGIDFGALKSVAAGVAKFREQTGLELCITVGAGNLWRYRDSMGSGIDRVKADQMGMAATNLNGVALASALMEIGVPATALTGFSTPGLVADYERDWALEMVEDGHVVVLCGGTGNPFFTTDSSAVLRALELNCDLFMKGTKVDGVYDKDPKKHNDAKKFEELSYAQVLEMGLEVMDLTAVSLAKDNSLPMLVFEFNDTEVLLSVLKNNKLGTLVS